MKENIPALMEKRFKKINEIYKQIINGFEIEPIHEFRTEVKKLRAFLRLLNVEMNDNRLKIPKGMKLFYGYAGTIRNLQLQVKDIYAYAGTERNAVVDTYVEYLSKMVEKWKQNAVDFSYSKKDFCDDEKKLQKRLPAKLRKPSIKKFIRNKIDEFEVLVKELPGEDILHSIRKLWKDILYNWKFIRPHKKMLPSYFSNKEKIKSFTELLGDFLDKHTSINLLETYCKDSEENGSFTRDDITTLQKIELILKKEKQDIAHRIYSSPVLQQKILLHAHQVVNPYFVKV